jgi:hypothetical protein
MIAFRKIYHLWLTLLLVCAINGLLIEALGQKRGDSVPPKTAPARASSVGPKRGEAIIEKEEAPGSKVVVKEVRVKPNEGALVLWAVSEAKITLTPLLNEKAGKSVDYDLGQGNKLTLTSLSPGKYQLKIRHPDYNLFTETITVVKGEPTALLPPLVSKYGSIKIVGAPEGVKILLDDKEPGPSNLKSDSEGITLSRVPVGRHKLRISKSQYQDLVKDSLEITPGELEAVAGKLELATVMMTLKSQPGAKVYINNEERGAVQPPDGKINISLLPGSYTVRLVKEGYESWEKKIVISQETGPMAVEAALIPIPESAEGEWNPSFGSKRWFPDPAKTWGFDKTGARVTGAAVKLFATDPNRDFNFYRDFILTFDFQFIEGQSIAWVARAQDQNNYYLLELNGPRENNPKTLIFYLCRDGVCRPMDQKPILDKIDTPGDSFKVTFEAREDRFTTRLSAASNPKLGAEADIIAIFRDKAFSVGGVGFRGKDQTKALIQFVNIRPLK